MSKNVGGTSTPEGRTKGPSTDPQNFYVNCEGSFSISISISIISGIKTTAQVQGRTCVCRILDVFPSFRRCVSTRVIGQHSVSFDEFTTV